MKKVVLRRWWIGLPFLGIFLWWRFSEPTSHLVLPAGIIAGLAVHVPCVWGFTGTAPSDFQIQLRDGTSRDVRLLNTRVDYPMFFYVDESIGRLYMIYHSDVADEVLVFDPLNPFVASSSDRKIQKVIIASEANVRHVTVEELNHLSSVVRDSSKANEHAILMPSYGRCARITPSRSGLLPVLTERKRRLIQGEYSSRRL